MKRQLITEAQVDVPTALEILRRFRKEKTDPEPFYVGLADRTIGGFTHQLRGQTILDLGCGPGWYTVALERAGANVVGLDLGKQDVAEASQRDVVALVGDGMQLPFASGTFDGVFCSNLLEHVPDPGRVTAEISRVLKPGGWGWISWTPWFSPWGGHEIVPFHLLGPKLGPRTWERFRGKPEKNVPYDGLWPTYVGRVVREVRADQSVSVDAVYPRYYPFMRWMMSVPGLREFGSWNCVIEITRLGSL